MVYENIVRAVFIDRPNRFIARVAADGLTESVHVKNTGRCKELLIPGATVWLTASGNEARKTKYDLVAVSRLDGKVFNIDSQAPNRVIAQWLASQRFERIVPEYRYGHSRIDFYMERGGEKYLIEVKGCTLEADGVGYFPDAPTERGVKHIRELIGAAAAGYCCVLAFVIQMDGVTEVRANVKTDPAFAAALEDAKKAGVRVMALPCRVQPQAMNILPGYAL